MIIKSGEQRFVTDKTGAFLRPIPYNVGTDVKFDREQFINDLNEVVTVGEYTMQEIAKIVHSSVGKVWETVTGKDSVIITPEMMWFVSQMSGKELSAYFGPAIDIEVPKQMTIKEYLEETGVTGYEE